MIFTDPTDFNDALRLAASRDLLPTDLSAAEIRDRFAADILRRSVFSARTDSALYLQEVEDRLEEYLAGTSNLATVREALQAKLDALGYTAEHGFAESAGAVPPADEGGLRDLASRGRQDLMITTQARQQMNRGYIEKWTDPAQRAAFPAWELVRIAPREVPRGEKRTKAGIVPDPGNDWPSRWAKAGGSFYGGRMIALVDDDVWQRIGSSELFSDGLDNPYAPFAFGSGYGLRAVPSEECARLGINGGKRSVASPAGVDGPEKLPPVPTSLSKDILGKLKAALDRELGDWDSGALMKRELAAARGVKNRLLILNDGNSEGAKKGWETRRGAIAKDIKAGRRAMRISLNQKRDMPEVLKRGPIRIDYDYGHPGNPAVPRDDGYGLSHTESKHPEDLHRLPVTTARGSMHEHEEAEKLYVVHRHHIAVMRKKERNDGRFSDTRYGVTTHFEHKKTALRVKQRTVVLEGR